MNHWYEIFDYTLDDTDTNALYQLPLTGGITFYLAKANYDVPEDSWGIGTSHCCGNTVIRLFKADNSEEAKKLGTLYVKEFLKGLFQQL